MLLKEILAKGRWVVSNKDGKEKRFKDANSAEARAWKDSSSSKAAKYSQEWWDNQDAEHRPADKITMDDDNQIDRILAKESHRKPDDWTFSGHYTKNVNGVIVAGRVIRAGWVITKDDDLGVEDDVEHYENFGIVRDVKNPTKFVFDGYK